jgi:hypothetical protein
MLGQAIAHLNVYWALAQRELPLQFFPPDCTAMGLIHQCQFG